MPHERGSYILGRPPTNEFFLQHPLNFVPLQVRQVPSLRETGSSPGARRTRGRTSCTLGSLPRVQLSGKRVWGSAPRGSRLPREPEITHSGKASLRGVKSLGEEILFFNPPPKSALCPPPAGHPPLHRPPPLPPPYIRPFRSRPPLRRRRRRRSPS
jgi:hypothetical protein